MVHLVSSDDAMSAPHGPALTSTHVEFTDASNVDRECRDDDGDNDEDDDEDND